MVFKFTRLEIPDVLLVEGNLFQDARGTLMEAYNSKEFAKIGMGMNFMQDLISKSKKNVLRGLHYQLRPNAQTKLVSVISGRIFDVAVDIRKKSRTYSKWVGVELSEDDKHMLLIPEGFAHGYFAIEDSKVLYKIAGEYSKADSRGIAWNDRALGIKWPKAESVITSDSDKAWPELKNADNNFD